MFKCKQCGQPFTANPPDACPACGAENRKPEDMSSGKWLGLVLMGAGLDLIVFAILVGIIVALASGIKTSALQKIHNFEQIYAIESDADFKGGDYYGAGHPDRGHRPATFGRGCRRFRCRPY